MKRISTDGAFFTSAAVDAVAKAFEECLPLATERAEADSEAIPSGRGIRAR